MKRAGVYLVCALAAGAAEASVLQVDGGMLALGLGTAASAGEFRLGAGGTLGGHGEIRAPAVLAGTVSPGASATNAGTLRFAGGVSFAGGIFACHAEGNERLDRIEAAGAVEGVATVRMTKKSSHVVPLGQIIVRGAPGSDYTGFTQARPEQWRLEPDGGLDLAVTDLHGDTNMDGMPDWWEQWYFGGRTASGATNDPDGDRFANLGEYRAGTEPLDGESALRIEAARRLPGNAGFEVRWQSVTGRTYRLVGCDPALTGGWFGVSLEIPAGTGRWTSWTNDGTPLPRFHAVELTSP